MSMERDMDVMISRAREDAEWDTEENGQEREPPGPPTDSFQLRRQGSPGDFSNIDNSNIGEGTVRLAETQPNLEINNDEYFCSVHGTTKEIISFQLGVDPKEIYCMLCWRQQFRDSMSQVTPLETEPNRGTEEETNED